ncbi:MAG TPA: hypothetical protein VFS20_21735 [Longimicrobium sp.]|nr:hypothetical protein [Longimicrobium sp.]
MSSRFLILPAAIAVLAAACADGTSLAPTATRAAAPPRAAAVAPTFFGGNISGDGTQVCNTAPVNAAGGWLGYKVEGYGSSQTGGITVTVTGNNTIAWSATPHFAVTAVLVKGGTGQHVYYYDGNAAGDAGLVSPLNNAGNLPDISHYTVCYRVRLAVTKTAATTYHRAWAWGISKTADQSALTLTPSETFTVNYQVKVDTLGSTDGNFTVAGTIRVHNPAPIAAVVTGVADQLSDNTSVTVSCLVDFPHTLGAGESFECAYAQSLPGKATLTNTATATTSTPEMIDGSGSAAVVFGEPTTKIDDCISVTDTMQGVLSPSVCLGAATFNYARQVGPYGAVGQYTADNTATFTANTTGAQGSSTVSIAVTVSGQGCTLTQGYWKNHADPSQKRFDSVWNNLPNGGATAFYHSGKSWLGVFNTPPAGNAYYTLAHQFMAARLNVLGGAATTPAVDAAMNAAHGFFSNPANVPSVKLSNAVKATLTGHAGMLASYNEGATGPGHCSER